jgi:hypothetical protein
VLRRRGASALCVNADICPLPTPKPAQPLAESSLNRNAPNGVYSGDMRNLASRPARSLFVGGVAVLLLAAAPAAADDLAGAYDVKFEQISTNCDQPLSYDLHGSLKIEIKGTDLVIDIERTPLMVGKSPKSVGAVKISAKSPKPGHTKIQGMDGVFSVAGRITADGMLSLVMVGEYQTAGKPLCSQSWNLSGLRSRGDKEKDKPKK